MTRTLSYTETLTVTRCWCGIALAIPDNLLRHAMDDGQSVYCPLGHAFCWKETEADRLKKQLANQERIAAQRLAALDQERAAREAEKRSHAATKGQLTKARKRAAASLCPVPGCKRQIVQMQRHLASKHPDWHAEHADGESS